MVDEMEIKIIVQLKLQLQLHNSSSFGSDIMKEKQTELKLIIGYKNTGGMSREPFLIKRIFSHFVLMEDKNLLQSKEFLCEKSELFVLKNNGKADLCTNMLEI